MGEKQRGLAIPSSRLWWILIAALALFLYLIRAILPPFLIGIAAAYVLSPVVSFFQHRWGVPRAIVVFAVYLLLLGPLVLVLIFLGPRFFEESRDLIVRAPEILSRLIVELFGPGPYSLFGAVTTPRQIAFDLVGSLRASLGTPSTAIHLASRVGEFLLGVFLALIVSIYLLLDSARFTHMVFRLIPPERRPEFRAVSEEIHRALGRYFRGEMFLVALMTLVSFLGLELIFQLPYALPLAVATGFLEIIPFLGPVLAGASAAALALSQGGVELAVGVIIFYTVIRQVEDQVVMPVVLGRAVELHPLVVLFAVFAGGALFGAIGALVAIPIAASIKVMVDAWLPMFSGKEVGTE